MNGTHNIAEETETSMESEVKEKMLLTHHQVSIMLDKFVFCMKFYIKLLNLCSRRARVGFPLAFLMFNIFYWIFVSFWRNASNMYVNARMINMRLMYRMPWSSKIIALQK